MSLSITVYTKTGNPAALVFIPICAGRRAGMRILMISYNRDAAVGYAIQFTDVTKGYSKYNQNGFGYIATKTGVTGRGDCANFVSQCLWAGGLPMTNEWYNHTPYSNPGTGTTTWNGTFSQRRFLLKRCWAKEIAKKDIIGVIKKGDIVYTVKNGSYTHVVMVSRDIKADGKVYVCGHTANQRDKERRPQADAIDCFLHIEDSISLSGNESRFYGYSEQRDFETAMLNYGPDALHPGEENSYILNMQRRLSYLGCYNGSYNGKYDAMTESAVEMFQFNERLITDGIADWKTKNALYHPKNYHKV